MKHLLCHLLFYIIQASVSNCVKVKVKQGLIIGTRGSTVFESKLYFAFYGVPYARAPIGKLRFKDPKPPKKWKTPFDASTEYHGGCAQAHIVHKHAVYGYEDCLHLNIFTPCLPNNGEECSKAVIVWIHGYAFASSVSHIHGPDFLIDNDVLFISVTHRIGVFGFLKVNDNDPNANMGLKDILMAMKWIRGNVERFGGDRNRITIMGSGSAVNLIALLMTAKRNKLFSRAILQSGSLYSPSIFQSNHKLERDRLQAKLKDVGIGSLTNASTKDLIMFSQKIYTREEIINFQRPVVPFTPIEEKLSKQSLLTKQSIDLYTNTKSLNIDIIDIPIMIGFNTQEGISQSIPFLHNSRYLKMFIEFFKFMVPFTTGCKFNSSSMLYNKAATEIKKKYFKGGVTASPIQNFLRYASDLHTYPIYKFIKELQLNVQKKMFVYKFNYSGKFNLVKATSLYGAKTTAEGAAEGDEICYVLKCEPLWESYVKLRGDIYDGDRVFVQRIASMWANFAKFGDPAEKRYGNTTWPPMTISEDNVLVLEKEDRLHNFSTEYETLTFWNEIYDKYYANIHCDSVRDEF